MTEIRADDAIIAELSHPDLYDLVVAIMSIIDAHGSDVSPSAVEGIRKSTPVAWRNHGAALIDIALGTRRAERLGKSVPGWLFTTTSAQQSTHPSIADHHAARFAGTQHLVEVCLGAGLDTRALARVCDRVTTFEADPLTAALAEGNFRRAGIRNVTVVTDRVPCEAYRTALATADALWADPSRRDERATRQRRASAYDPPLGLFTTAGPTLRVVGLKVGPGDTLDPDVTHGFTSEYIGWRDECRERLLWRGVAPPTVSLVDVGQAWTAPDRTVRSAEPAVIVPQPDMILVEPHAAVIASGNVSAYFAQINAGVIDPRIGYGLCAADPGPSPLHRRFRLLAVDHGIDVKHIQRRVRDFGWSSSTEIKKRGVDIDPMALHHKLSFVAGGSAGVIVLTRGEAARMTLYALRDGRDGPDGHHAISGV
jgi:hypothetical protein